MPNARRTLALLLFLASCGDGKPAGSAPAGSAPAGGPGLGSGAGGKPGSADGSKAAPAARPAAPAAPLPADSGAHDGRHRFSLRLGGKLADSGRAIAVDPAGNLAVAGYLRDAVDLGDGVVAKAVDGTDGFVASLGPDRKVRWARALGGKGDDTIEAVATDAAGNVVVAGAFSFAIEMADGKLESRGADDIVVAKFGPDGRRAWVQRFGGVDVDVANGVATDAAGNVYLTGEINQSVEIGGQTLEGLGAADMLVAKLSPDGKPLWAKRFGARGPDYGRQIRATADGVVVLGEMSRTVDFGRGPLETHGNRDVVVVSLDADGATRWATSFGGSNDELAVGLAVDPTGAAIVTGSFDGDLGFAGTTLKTAGLADAFVAKLDPRGAPAWIRAFGSKESDIGAGVATDASGNVYAVGWFWYTVDFGKGGVASLGKKDSYVVALGPDGATLWAQRSGGKENDFLQAITVLPDGGLAAIGTFHGQAAYGGEPLATAGVPEAQLPMGDVVVVGLER
jgi:hypothetical protein